MSAPWDVVGTPLHRLHRLHQEALEGYSLEAREESLFGGRSPREVVQSGAYVPLEVEGGGESLQAVITGALTQGRGLRVEGPAGGGGRALRVEGPAGGGKTTAVQKLVGDWASGACLAQLGFLFPLALGQLGSGERSLADLLSQQHPHLPAASLELVLQNPHALLFVLDGLEQNQNQPASGPPCRDPHQPAPLSALVWGLIQGTLLAGASVLVTSRPGEAPGPECDSALQRVGVRGLSRGGREAFVRRCFPEADRAREAQGLLEQSAGLWELCRTPGFCWSACSALRAARGAGWEQPRTLTGMFSLATAVLIRALGEEPAGALLAALGKMAAAVLLDGAERFSREELEAFGLSLPPPAPPVPLGEFLRPHGPLDTPGRLFSFSSPALPHFLLAVAYHRGSWDRAGVAGLLETVADGGKADLLEPFLAGLCDPSQRASLEGVAGGLQRDRARAFGAWLSEATQDALQSYDQHRPLHCFRLLQHCQDPALVLTAVQPAARLGRSYGGLGEPDADALSYVAQCCGALEQLNLYASKNLSEPLLTRLAPAIRSASKIILTQSRLSPECYAPLTAGLRSGAVRELDLSYCIMGERGAQSLCTGLDGSRVEILRLPCCGLKEQDCGALASALSSSQLHLLDLRGNDIQDAGLAQLSQALSSPECQLQELGLGMCKLTGSSMEALSWALCSGSSALRSLELQQNELGDAGMDWISTALRDTHCCLEKLLVWGCGLTEACCGSLADALRAAGGTVTELDLSVNELGDAGVLQLTHTFKTSHCTPRVLRLARCEVGERVFAEFGAVLRVQASPLRELDMGLHPVGDAGATPLWDALRDPACSLEHLDVEMVGLTDGCVAELCAAVRSSSSLKSLVLKNNQLTDAAVGPLIAMAKSSRTLRELNLQYNDFSEDVFELMDSCGKIKY